MFFSYLRLSMREEKVAFPTRICLLQYNKQEETGETVRITRRTLLEKEQFARATLGLIHTM